MTEADDLIALQERLGVAFHDLSLLQRALTHTSYLNEHPDCGWTDNERLEYLGDAVAGWIASEMLYHRYAELSEGELTSLRAELVRSDTLALFATRIGLGTSLLMGKGEEQGAADSERPILRMPSRLCSRRCIWIRAPRRHDASSCPFLRAHLESSAHRALGRDAKTRLQEWAQSFSHQIPAYSVLHERGPDHARQFTIEVRVGETVQAQGTGPSKQDAEQRAAQSALDELASPPGDASQ